MTHQLSLSPALVAPPEHVAEIPARTKPAISVVIATYNRPHGIVELLRDLSAQEGIAPSDFEVIVVDDGSRVPVRPLIDVGAYAYALRVEEQANAGQGAARHRGLTHARADIVVSIDDDMRLPPNFLAAHLAAHRAGAEVVQGNILPPSHELPIFERWHARQLAQFASAAAAGTTKVRGAHLATGNVSWRMERYREVGGFDAELKQSEDRDLGIRFEQAGAVLAFSADAASVHQSDHTSLDGWLRRSFNYGRFDSQIARKHETIEYVDPWRFLFAAPLPARPFLLAAALVPSIGKAISRAVMPLALLADRVRLNRLAMMATGFVYGMEYFRGVRDAAGSLGATRHGFKRYVIKRSRHTLGEGRAAPIAAWSDFRRAVHVDWSTMGAGRAKYLGETESRRWVVDVVTKIGLQMTYAIRVMRLLRDCGFRLGAQFASRMIRHAYAAEIHWDAEFDPGLSIIHGNGLVVSHAARVGEGCVLCHNVTLGMGIDPQTGDMGAPTLERNVHVGPGATLLGPIVIGEGSKVMAGAVLNRSVPPYSLVRPAPAEVDVRARR